VPFRAFVLFFLFFLFFGLAGAGCGPTICPYCPPGTSPADPTKSCSPCLKSDGGVTAQGDANDANADETDLSTEAPDEAATQQSDGGADADATSQ
jgi:hypothetical protein